MILRPWFCSSVGSVDPHGSGVFAWRYLPAKLDLWTEPVVSVTGRPRFGTGAGLGPDDHHWLEAEPGWWAMLRDWAGCPVTTAWFLNSSQESGHLPNVQLRLDAGGTRLTAATVREVPAGHELLWSYRLAP